MMWIKRHMSRLAQDDEGATLVEFGIIMAFLLFVVFGLVDFSRLGFSYVMAQKATQYGVREAAVSVPACAGLPLTNERGLLQGPTDELEFGASCSVDASLCKSVATVSCTAANGSATSTAIWAKMEPLMPANSNPTNILFTYRFDPNLGFLGGPYTPLVTVEIIDLDFQFVTPLGALAAVAGATGAQSLGDDIIFPSMSASLPSEALGRL